MANDILGIEPFANVQTWEITTPAAGRETGVPLTRKDSGMSTQNKECGESEQRASDGFVMVPADPGELDRYILPGLVKELFVDAVKREIADRIARGEEPEPCP